MSVSWASEERLPELLHNGDRMTRAQFHRAYSQMPDNYKAELIGGIVFEPSPLGYPHGEHHLRLGNLLDTYRIHTPGTGAADSVTVMLSDEDEVQPDLVLRLAQELGGRSRLTRDRYVKGAPELVAEIAHSSRAIDLHLKKERYTLAGVVEYVVVCVSPKQIYWFDLPGRKEMAPDNDGVFRSAVFPGLWIHGDGLLKLEGELTLDILNRGLRSPEHKEFVSQLARRR